MTKHYCDICGNEVTGAALDSQPDFTVDVRDWAQDTSPERTVSKVEVKIMRALDGGWNSGHLCVQCLAEILERGRISLLHRSPYPAPTVGGE